MLVLIVLPFPLSDFRTVQLATVGAYFIAILGLDILTGHSGQISLGHGAFMAVGALHDCDPDVGPRRARPLDDPGRRGASRAGSGCWRACRRCGSRASTSRSRRSASPSSLPTILKKFDGLTGGSTGITLFGKPTQTGHGSR